MIKRNRTPSEYIGYGLYLYFSGLSLRRASQMLSCFIRRNHVTIWNWIQKYKPQKIKSKRKKVSEYIVDETMLKVGSEYIWLWIAIEPENKQILALYIYQKREKHVCSRTLSVICCP
jgi:putative transposase